MSACKQCQNPLSEKRKQYNAIFCGSNCLRLWYKEQRPKREHSGHVTGTLSCLIVATDLTRKGWEVYFPFDRAICDLIAIKEDKVIRLEVRAATRILSGELRWGKWPKRDEGKTYAAVALDSGEEVVYEPQIA